MSEIAKKEKERRKKIGREGQQVRVITEADLRQGTSTSVTPEETSSPSPSSGPVSTPTSRQRGEVAEEQRTEPGGAEEFSLDTNIPREAPLEEKIRIFERLKAAYNAHVKNIDAQIAKNNVRLAAIEQELSSIGAGGLPVAVQANREPRHEGEFIGLQNEKTQLQQQNSKLEAEKKTTADALRDKGRRAGIPPGNLRF